MFDIEELVAREIFDSRGHPTLEVDCLLAGGALGRAAVPSGASIATGEAQELRDGGERFLGRGITKAVENVQDEIAHAIEGMDARDQVLIDRTLIELDGTVNKSRLGANAILGVSMAVAKAAADLAGLPFYAYLGGPMATLLPVPLMTVLSGGPRARNALDLRSLMIVPMGFDACSEALRAGAEIYQTVQKRLDAQGLATTVGDDGGFAPELTHQAAFDLLMKSIEEAGYLPGEQIGLALDVAASELASGPNGIKVSYALPGDGRSGLSSEELIEVYREWIAAYPLVSIEDGLAENDHQGWSVLTYELGDDVQLVGGDLFATQPPLIADGIGDGLANSVLIKVNQLGTLTETLKAVELAKINAYTNIISHRSGETGDSIIADLAVATQAGQIKAGAPCRSDRVAKYNRLLRIEEELEDAATFLGATAFPRWDS